MTEPQHIAPSPPARTLKLRAIVIALVTFAVLHVVLLAATRALVTSPDRATTFVPLLNVAGFLLYVAVGFIAGGIARNAGVAHGIVAGLFASLVAILFFAAAEQSLMQMAVLAVNGLLFGGIGGACSMLLPPKQPGGA